MLLVMAFAFIFFVAKGCVATQESTQIRKYVTNANSQLSDSSNLGNEKLLVLLRNAGGNPAKLDEGAPEGVAAEARDQYLNALTNEEVPPEFDDANHYLVTTLGIRARATKQLAQTAAEDPDGFKGALATAVEDYRLSDAVVRNHYLPAVQEALVEAGQQRDQGYLGDPEPFMDYEEVGFDVAAPAPGVARGPVRERLRRVSADA
ncbi:MAG: hypothetical protein M3324_07045 [Actinomycetota bacterium]|nr:hypothetical protein [Actinomycetota bacterium]